MTVIVKIMESGEPRQPSEPQASFRLVTGVHDVQFTRDLTGQAFVSLQLDRASAYPGEATPGDHAGTNIHQELHTQAFVMNEAGKTVATFDGRPTGVQITLDGKPFTIGAGLVKFAFLRQLLRVDEEAPLYIRRERSDSYYGRTIPYRTDVPRGEVWETVGRGDHWLWVSADDVFVTQLGKGAVLDDPKPSEPVVPLGPPPKGDDDTFFANVRRAFDENPDAQVILYRRGDEIHFCQTQGGAAKAQVRFTTRDHVLDDPKLAAAISRLAQTGRTWTNRGRDGDPKAEQMRADGHAVLSFLHGREDYPLDF